MALENILENQYVSTSLAVFLVLYGGLAAPKLSKDMVKIFTNPFFRMLIIFLIAYTSSKNHSIALVATIVLILIMQDSNNDDKLNVQNKVVNTDTSTRSIITKQKFDMDEEEGNSEGEIIHILKDKTTVTESQLINSVINNEINKLQDGNQISQNSEPVVSELVVSEPVVSESVVSEPVVSEPVVSEQNIPQPMDKTESNLATQIEDNPLSKNFDSNKLNKVPIRSTRGLENRKSCGSNGSGKFACNECSTCNSFKKDNYSIDIDDLVLPYDGNGFYNFGNI
jgi:hypothetical protein